MKLYTPLVNKAMIIAYNAHLNQTDKCDVPYIYHPAYLAAQMDTEDEIITALLHDVVEDTPVTLGDLEREGFPQAVLDALRLLTHADGTDYMDYVRRIKQNPLAVKVKLADLRHNNSPTRNACLPAQDAAWYHEKYTKAIYTLEYDRVCEYPEAGRIAAEKDGKWGFIGEPHSFVYTNIKWHYGELVGVREDGTMDRYGRYYTH